MWAHYHRESSWQTSFINGTKQAYMMGKLWTSQSLAKAFQVTSLLLPHPHPSPAGEGCCTRCLHGAGMGAGRITPKARGRSPRLGPAVPRAKDLSPRRDPLCVSAAAAAAAARVARQVPICSALSHPSLLSITEGQAGVAHSITQI